MAKYRRPKGTHFVLCLTREERDYIVMTLESTIYCVTDYSAVGGPTTEDEMWEKTMQDDCSKLLRRVHRLRPKY